MPVTGNRTLASRHTDLDNSRLTVRADGVYPDTVVANPKLFREVNVDSRSGHLRYRGNRRVRAHPDTQVHQYGDGVALCDGVKSSRPNAMIGCNPDDVEVPCLRFSKHTIERRSAWSMSLER